MSRGAVCACVRVRACVCVRACACMYVCGVANPLFLMPCHSSVPPARRSILPLRTSMTRASVRAPVRVCVCAAVQCNCVEEALGYLCERGHVQNPTGHLHDAVHLALCLHMADRLAVVKFDERAVAAASTSLVTTNAASGREQFDIYTLVRKYAHNVLDRAPQAACDLVSLLTDSTYVASQ